jgi:plasmid segregation protein ParM
MPQSYYAIVVVGGGAIVFKEHLQRLLPNAVFSDEFANARGLLKYLIAQG